MARAAALVREDERRAAGFVGVYPIGEWGEIIADENSIVGQQQSTTITDVVVTNLPGDKLQLAGNAAVSVAAMLSPSRSSEAAALSKFFFQNVVVATSALSRAAKDPFEFESVPPKATTRLTVTVKSTGRAAAPRFEE